MLVDIGRVERAEKERVELQSREKVDNLVKELKTTKESSKEYINRFVDRLKDLKDNEIIEFEKQVGVDVDRIIREQETFADQGLDLNHRLPPGMLRAQEKADVLNRVGEVNINSPPLMDVLTRTANRGQHNQLWQRHVSEVRAENFEKNGVDNLSEQQIFKIWSDVEKSVPFSYELPNSINPNNYIK